MDVLNYDNAVSAFNNLEAFQSEKQQQLKDLVEQYREGAGQVVLPALDLFRRGYNKFTGEKSVAGKGEGAVAGEGEGAVEGAVEGVEGAIKGVGSELSEGVQSAISGVTSKLGEFSSSVRGIGNQLSERMRTNAFERDPETEISSSEDNMSLFDKAQSLFRGGSSEASQGIEGAVEGAVKGAVKTGGEAVGEAVGEGIGAIVGDAIPVIGELGMLGLGVYDFVKSFTEKPSAPLQGFAQPVLEKGI